MDNNYTIIHLHTDFSNGTTNIDSVTKYKEYIAKAQELGMKSLAFTEHGNVYSWLSKLEACTKAGIKYIHGSEVYITESLTDVKRDNYHTVLLAKNLEGMHELNKLISHANNRQDGHFYYVPRISIDEFENISDNIVVTSACLGGVLGKGNNEIRKRYLSYFIQHKDRCFLEIQHHSVPDQIYHNQKLKAIADKLDLQLVVGTDTHSLDERKARGTAILQRAKNVFFADEEGWDLTMKSYDELVEAYAIQDSLPMDVVLTAIENTNKIADMIEDYKIDRSHKYPPMAENPELETQKQIANGIRALGINKYPDFEEYKKRIVHEMDVYRHNGAFNFMLLMSDVVNFCRDNDIKIGYGRGSVTGSVVAYLMGITQMDSIKHKLNFERFMNSERVSLADIDSDFPPSRREEVRAYLAHKKGLYTADIVTFNTIALKGAIKDVGRALGIPLKTTDEISKNIELKEADYRLEYPLLFDYVDIVNGTIVSVGIHPSACIVSPIPLDDSVGLYGSKDTIYPISQLHMKEIDSLNFVKLDLLGLATVEIIDMACQFANIDFLTPDTIDDSDEAVWHSMRESTTGVFQWDKLSGSHYYKELFSENTIKILKQKNPNFKYMDLFSVGNGAIRPAGNSYRDALARGEFRDNGHPALNEFLASTNGFLVFQEQVMEFLHKFCGYSMGEADIVRRAFSKKTGTETHLPKIKEGFINTMREKYNVNRIKAEEIIISFLQIIQDASDYLFNLNHAEAYSYMGYACAWLRYHYPVEFLTASLIVKNDKKEDTIALSQYAREIGVKIENPKYGYSKGAYNFDAKNKIIYKGVGSVKGINKTVGDKLYALSQFRKHDDFIDLLVDIFENGMAGKSALLTLASLDYFNMYSKNKKIMDIISMFFEGKGVKYDKKLVEKTKLARTQMLKDAFNNIPNEELSIREQIKAEVEYLGYATSSYPHMDEKLYIITDVQAMSWATRVTAVHIRTGEMKDYMLSKKAMVGVRQVFLYGIMQVDKQRTDKRGSEWIESYIMVM